MAVGRIRPTGSEAGQEPEDVNVGADEEEPIQLVSDRFPDFDVPTTGDVINVTVTPAG